MLSSRLSAVDSATSQTMAISVSPQTMPVTGQPQPARHRGGGDDELGGQLGLRAERSQVVEQAEHDAAGAADDEADEGGARCPAETQADRGAGGDGQAAQHGHRPAVPAIAARPGDDAEAIAPAACRRRWPRAVTIAAPSAVTTRSIVGDIDHANSTRARRGRRAGAGRERRCRRPGGRCRSARPPRRGRRRRGARHGRDPRSGRRPPGRRAAASPMSTMTPVSPSVTTSSTPPARVETTGRPAAIASISATGEPSFFDVRTTTSRSA